jgi:hypothetical protein
MNDKIERVARAIQEAHWEISGYEGMARAAIEIAKEPVSKQERYAIEQARRGTMLRTELAALRDSHGSIHSRRRGKAPAGRYGQVL